MPDSVGDKEPQQSSLSQIEEKLEAWKQMRDQGQILPAEELCEDSPELLDELRRRIDDLEYSDENSGLSSETIGDTKTQVFSQKVSPAEISAEMSFGRLRFHDSGGLGEIYQAEDIALSRDVALKFIRPEALSNAERRERFLLEAKVTGQLDHPGIVPIMGLGQDKEGRPFYVMRFIRGKNLDELIQELYRDKENKTIKPNEFRERFLGLLRHFTAACKTIAYAHKRGIVHFDIKPKNIMLGKYGETLVVDWGEAVPLAQVSQTHLGSEGPIPIVDSSDGTSSLSGGATLPYIAPERLPLSPTGYPGPRSDIYSLGVSLYKLLTGREAFCGSRNEIIQRVRQGVFPRPRQIEESGKDVSKSLEAVCLKAMSMNPADRYSTAKHLADDIERWMDDEPVSALKEGRSQRLARWMRRHRNFTQVLLISLLVVLLLSISSASFFSASANREKAAKKESLLAAAGFAAQTIASKIEERFWILQTEADKADLQQALATVQEGSEQIQAIDDNGNKGFKSPLLQDRMELIAKSYEQLNCSDYPGRTTDLLLLNAGGRIVGRYPYSNKTVGRFYWNRDYFHGDGKELGRNFVEQNPNEAPDPVSGPHQSVVFRNDSYHHLIAAFSTPIHDESHQETLGVLVMQVNLGRFAELDSKYSRQNVVLVNLKRDAIEPDEGEEQLVNKPGLILHHTGNSLLESDARETAEPRYVSPGMIKNLETLQRADRDQVIFLEKYTDPISPKPTLAAAAPILVQGNHWDIKVKRVQWAVIVQDSTRK